MHLTTYRTAEDVMAATALMPPGVCGPVPPKSRTILLPETSMETRMGTGPEPKPSSSMKSSAR